MEFSGHVELSLPHRLRITRGAFEPTNPVLAEALASADGAPGSARALVVIDQGVADHWRGLTARVENYFATHEGMPALDSIHVIPGGEDAKNDRGVFERVLGAIAEAGLCRHSYVIAIGGGALLDVAGFAAAVAHRGVRLVRLPTTTLAQCDSGVGVKNGINACGKKNFLGAFAVPWAVINDEDFLATLSDRDFRCGFSEAVKVALMKDATLFDTIRRGASAIVARDLATAAPVLRRSAELHIRHILESGDPFEFTSARPLDFGHWAAHRLEQMTDFRMRHGEGVAIGIALDVTYSRLAGMLKPADAEAIIDTLATLGFTLRDPAMADRDTLLAGIEEFREHLGGQLTITLLNGIGQPLDAHRIDRATMLAAIAQVSGPLSLLGRGQGRHGGDSPTAR